MKVILLRHEKREDYSGYFSNLTDDGLKDSFKLEKKLSKMNIDKIYSSPFVRTLQTIFPYATKQNKKGGGPLFSSYDKHLLKPSYYSFIILL